MIHAYAFAELERVLGGVQPHAVAERLGCNVKTVHQWRRRRWLTWAQADRLAVRAGYTPYDVWGSGWADETSAFFARLRTEREESRNA